LPAPPPCFERYTFSWLYSWERRNQISWYYNFYENLKTNILVIINELEFCKIVCIGYKNKLA